MSYQHAQQVFEFHGELNFSDFIDYIWENSDSIYKDEYVTPQYNFSSSYDSYFSLENLKDANLEIHEKTGIELDDVRDKNLYLQAKGANDHLRSHINKGQRNQKLLDQNKIPVTENMYTYDMIKKSQHFICKIYWYIAARFQMVLLS